MPRKLITSIAIAFIFLILVSASSFARPNASQTTAFIDVGQGDAALIQDGAGFDVLIDGGQTSAGPTVVAYLRGQGITDLDVMVASHADSDHIGGLIDVLEAQDITVHQVLYNGYPGDTATWGKFATAVATDGLALTPVQYPQELDWGSMDAHVLNPSSGLSTPETNKASLVLRVDINGGQVKYLFPGDIDSTIEATVVARGTPLASDILKVAHHGSASSSSAGFLAAADPQAAIISVGANNSYGHPSAETISRLLASGAAVGRTDELGTILVTSDGTTYSILPALVPLLKVYLPLLSR